MQIYNGTVVLQFDDSTTGNADSGALVTVRQASAVPGNGDLSIIYDLYDVQILNPLTTDAQGNYNFKAVDGLYDIVIRENQTNEFILAGERLASNSTIESILLTPIEGQLIYPLPVAYVNVAVAYVWIDGRKMRQDGSNPDFSIDVSNNLILTEPVETNQVLEVSFNTSAPNVPTILEPGSLGNPYVYSTLYAFVNALPYIGFFKNGDWIQFNGRTLEADGHASKYQITNSAPSIRRNYENYIPLDGDGASTGVTLWAVLKEGFKRDFKEQPVEIIAHRGFNSVSIQNTVLAMSNAMQLGADSLEMDIQVTSDGVLVCYHDLTLDQDTDGTGAISSKTYAELQALTFDELAGTLNAGKIKISKFEDVLKYAKSCGARIYPEIKAYRTISDIKIITDMISSYNYDSMTILSSFNFEDLEEVRRLNKRIGVGWLTVNINGTEQYDYFDRLQKLKYADVLLRADRVRQYPGLVKLIYDAGLGCVAWTPISVDEIEQTFLGGVFRIIPDIPYDNGFAKGLQNVNY